MEIRIRDTGEVINEGTFRSLHPHSMGAQAPQLTEQILDSHGCDLVYEGPQATGGSVYQYSMRSGVEQLSDGKWYSKFILGPIFVDKTENGITVTASEQLSAYKQRIDVGQTVQVRGKRNIILSESDWTQVADSPVDKQAWAVYRQALRDLPSQTGFPWDVEWPTKP